MKRVDAIARHRRSVWRLVVLAVAFAHAGCAVDRGRAAGAEDVAALYASYRRAFPDVPEISVEALMAARDEARPGEGEVVLVDVRDASERAVSVIPGAISVEELQAAGDVIQDRLVVTYCTIGYRSGRYAERLLERDFRVANLEGSLLAWIHAGGALVDAEGPTRRVHVYGKRWNLLPAGYEPVW